MNVKTQYVYVDVSQFESGWYEVIQKAPAHYTIRRWEDRDTCVNIDEYFVTDTIVMDSPADIIYIAEVYWPGNDIPRKYEVANEAENYIMIKLPERRVNVPREWVKQVYFVKKKDWMDIYE